MDFAAAATLQLLDSAEIAALLTPAVGDRIMAAAFSPDAVGIGTVSAVNVRRVELAPTLPAHELIDVDVDVSAGARWRAMGRRVGAGQLIATARLDLALTVRLERVDTSVFLLMIIFA